MDKNSHAYPLCVLDVMSCHVLIATRVTPDVRSTPLQIRPPEILEILAYGYYANISIRYCQENHTQLLLGKESTGSHWPVKKICQTRFTSAPLHCDQSLCQPCEGRRTIGPSAKGPVIARGKPSSRYGVWIRRQQDGGLKTGSTQNLQTDRYDAIVNLNLLYDHNAN